MSDYKTNQREIPPHRHNANGRSVVSTFRVDGAGMPSGGEAHGEGFHIHWQEGPVVNGLRCGAFIEEVLLACEDRLSAFQEGRFACAENEKAARHIGLALKSLYGRSRDRVARGVEGKYEE